MSDTQTILNRLDALDKKVDSLQPPGAEKEYMDISALSEYLDISKNTLYYFVHRRELPF
jgi:hypothetical protein